MPKFKRNIFLLVLGIAGFLVSNNLTRAEADMWFSSYSLSISWNDERANLHNFAYQLEKDSDLIGCIGFYTNEKDKSDKVKSRINRAKKYLVSNLKVDKNRLVIIDAGKTLDESEIMLQPVLKNFPVPNF